MEEIIKRAKEKGIDIEDVLLREIAKNDPQEGVKLRLEIAESYMNEAYDYLKKGDPVQASEKAYKVAEEVVRALAEKFKTDEYRQASAEGRWYTYLLASATNELSKRFGDWVAEGWNAGYVLHVWGFHEGKLSVDKITVNMEKVKKMLEKAKSVLYQGL
ncbi:PaREP1 family protein [Stygiolobus caldivivus]|uniref:PaREP1 family protein n=1 Tax=Stygiolobus caldivivus TaxID=2824673 RepID=UPI001C862396|nr:PaREP1 family protein [Stygiolobus caldivivus]